MATVCPAVTVVLTKIDIVPRWRAVAERNRARLAAAGLRVEGRRRCPRRSGSPPRRPATRQLNEESGFGELVRTLRQDVLGNGDALASRSAAAADRAGDRSSC